jgi:2-keto-4-pentenoate hydratase/2-oxohepta-3-ene-1,7-dioic acid hydratase in catechol pathway
MKIVRFEWGQGVRYGVLEGDDVSVIEGDILGRFTAGEKLCTVGDVRLLAPVQPKTVACVAANYHGLMKYVDREIPKEPEVFLKPRSAVVGHLDGIVCPAVSKHLTCGGELAVVVKCEARNVPEDIALDFVLGYTCANDVTAWDLISERFPTRAKGFYTFCPLGPCISTDIDGDNVTLKSTLNGDLILDDSTSGMIFSVREAISYISQFMALEPLDVVLMGTPRPETTVEAGDVVEIEIDGIGTLRNTVVKGG